MLPAAHLVIGVVVVVLDTKFTNSLCLSKSCLDVLLLHNCVSNWLVIVDYILQYLPREHLG